MDYTLKEILIAVLIILIILVSITYLFLSIYVDWVSDKNNGIERIFNHIFDKKKNKIYRSK